MQSDKEAGRSMLDMTTGYAGRKMSGGKCTAAQIRFGHVDAGSEAAESNACVLQGYSRCTYVTRVACRLLKFGREVKKGKKQGRLFR